MQTADTSMLFVHTNDNAWGAFNPNEILLHACLSTRNYTSSTNNLEHSSTWFEHMLDTPPRAHFFPTTSHFTIFGSRETAKNN